VNKFVKYNDQYYTKVIGEVKRNLTIIPRDARMKDGKKKEMGESNKIEIEVEKMEEKRLELPTKKS
jgi:hypothetical protein